MTQLEDRLRRDLPNLADALAGTTTKPDDAAASGPASTLRVDERTAPASRWATIGAVAAAVALVITGVLAIGALRDPAPEDEPARSDSTAVPASFGEWSPMSDAPIDTRPYAVSAWTGSEAVFWAGSSLSRGFAFSDGAAYDPTTDTWRNLTVPGWGHPGLTSAYFDGQLYALAKGGGTRFDPVAGEWADLPQVDNMFLAATVASDDAVWGLGPASINPAGQPDLAIARYEPVTDTWAYGPVFEGTDQQAPIVAGLSQLESDMVWTGTEIVVWNGTAGGIAYDPSRQSWRTLDSPTSPSGIVSNSVLTMTDAGLVAVVEVLASNGSTIGIAVQEGEAWNWFETQIPIERFDTVTVAAADDWIVIFSADEPPATLHVPTGTWERDDNGLLAGIQGPNAVWTGDTLIVWGGQATPTSAITDPPDGARWTPPTR